MTTLRALCLAYGCIFGSVLVLKLCGVVTASWAWVLSPLWIPVLLTVGAVCGFYLAITRQGRGM